ncbi:hypothetical protein JKF63_07144 [Porcisia hertigi]|uniref:Uncharacterized protein n=1 Tax=Porcisia hertigi TaxID=2761500 RepID=A0A836YHM9_9TRYP|nr:hypothetical protein JKF63_07144 [Porcisia hertigi]
MCLLQRLPEASPQPQVVVRATVPGVRDATVSSAQGQQRPTLQCQREDLQHRCLPARDMRAMIASGCGSSAVDDPSPPDFAQSPTAANVPGLWSCESSILPHWGEDDGSPSDGTYRSTTASSTITNGCAVSSRHGASVGSSDDIASLADLQRRVAAQVERRTSRPPAESNAVSINAARISSSSWTSSCGCPTSCTCRSDTPDDMAGVIPVDVHKRTSRASRVCVPSLPRIGRAAVRRGAYVDCEVMAAQDMSHCSDASSETGATPARWSSDEDGGDLCSSCRHRCRDDSTAFGGMDSEDDSLCSVCKSHARARAVHRRGTAAPFAHRNDPFSEAVRTDALCPEVPPLLHLSTQRASCTGQRGGLSDAAAVAHRERADRKFAYIQRAAAFVGGVDDHRRSACDDVVAPVRELERCTGSTQTEAAAEQEVTEVKDITAPHSGEVALPLLQGELASLEARTAAQQQAHIDAVTQQMRMYHEEAQQRTQELIDLQMQHRQQLEQQHLAQREEANAARHAGARVDCGTSPMETAFATEAVDSTQQGALSRVSPRHAVGTQHSDNTLELLTATRTEAASWMARLLLSMEAERRNAVLQDEAESREQLLHVIEESSRCQLLRCQAEVLYWRQECAAVAHRASFTLDVRELALRERLSRQELAEEAAATRRDIIGNLERQRFQAAEAAVHSQMNVLKAELDETRSKLVVVDAEHADTLEHARQLRLQLIHALRMPTVTLLDRSMASSEARGGDSSGGVASAYAYATATTETEDTHTLGARGYAGECDHGSSPNVLASSPTKPGTGLLARNTVWSGIHDGPNDLPVHRRFARAHQEALRVTRAQSRTV